MLADYKDIKDRIKDPILWFDCNGVPRYDDFKPDLSPNIYAEEVCLLKIRCQNCRQEFLVEMNWSKANLIFNEHSTSLSEWIKRGTIHYGDPPRHDDHAGETMNCDDIEVVEFWSQSSDNWEWVRKKELEIKLADADV